MSTLAAKHDRIIMKELSTGEKMHGAIVIPDMENERSNAYEVIAVGPGLYNPQFDKCNPVSAKVGDIVVVPKVQVYNISIDNVMYQMTRDIEIQAIIVD